MARAGASSVRGKSLQASCYSFWSSMNPGDWRFCLLFCSCKWFFDIWSCSKVTVECPGVLMAAETFLVQSWHQPMEEAFPQAGLCSLRSRDCKATRAPFRWHGAPWSMVLLAEEVREGEACHQDLGNVVRPAKLYSVQLVWKMMPKVPLLAAGWAAQGEFSGMAVARVSVLLPDRCT